MADGFFLTLFQSDVVDLNSYYQEGEPLSAIENALLFALAEDPAPRDGASELEDLTIEDYWRMLEDINSAGPSTPPSLPPASSSPSSSPPSAWFASSALSASLRPIAPMPTYHTTLTQVSPPPMLPPVHTLIQEGNALVKKRVSDLELEKKKNKKGKQKATENDVLNGLTTNELVAEVIKRRKENKEVTERLDEFKNSNKEGYFIVTLWEENKYMKECLAIHQRVHPVPNLHWVDDGWDYYKGLSGTKEEEYYFSFCCHTQKRKKK